MEKILEKMDKKQSITVSGTRINIEKINKVWINKFLWNVIIYSKI